MLTSWRAFSTERLGIKDTEIKFLHLVLLEMALSHASQAQCGGWLILGRVHSPALQFQ